MNVCGMVRTEVVLGPASTLSSVLLWIGQYRAKIGVLGRQVWVSWPLCVSGWYAFVAWRKAIILCYFDFFNTYTCNTLYI
jgi:hypothetical protein